MKNNININKATYGKAWKDFKKVHNKVLMPSPLLNSLTKRITRNKRKKFITDVGLTDFCWPFSGDEGYSPKVKVALFLIEKINRQTYIKLFKYNIQQTAQNDEKIKTIPRVTEIILQIEMRR